MVFLGQRLHKPAGSREADIAAWPAASIFQRSVISISRVQDIKMKRIRRSSLIDSSLKSCTDLVKDLTILPARTPSPAESEKSAGFFSPAVQMSFSGYPEKGVRPRAARKASAPAIFNEGYRSAWSASRLIPPTSKKKPATANPPARKKNNNRLAVNSFAVKCARAKEKAEKIGIKSRVSMAR